MQQLKVTGGKGSTLGGGENKETGKIGRVKSSSS